MNSTKLNSNDRCSYFKLYHTRVHLKFHKKWNVLLFSKKIENPKNYFIHTFPNNVQGVVKFSGRYTIKLKENVYKMDRFYYYIYGLHITIHMDHRPLE